MAGYITYWPKEQIRALEKAGDHGPIKVVLGSIHTKMPSIKSVRVGDIIYPVTLSSGTLCAVARLPVEKVESAFDYLIRETGLRHAALVPEGVACWERPEWGGPWDMERFRFNLHTEDGVQLIDKEEDLPRGVKIVRTLAEPIPCSCHQLPFNCCSQTAASGAHGSTIELRPIDASLIPTLLFGPSPAKQKPLKRNSKGELTSLSLAGFARKMSPGTQAVFEALF